MGDCVYWLPGYQRILTDYLACWLAGSVSWLAGSDLGGLFTDGACCLAGWDLWLSSWDCWLALCVCWLAVWN
jgi:hypothetical protein